jgi:exosortase/archaeosortase family protein
VRRIVSKITTPLLGRVVVFLCFFVLVSGLIGARIIGGGILYAGGFAIYGGLGKAAIFGLIAFVLLVRKSSVNLTLSYKPWRPILLSWAVAALGFFVMAWTGVDSLLTRRVEIASIVGAHVGLVLCVACVAIDCFGPYNIRLLWRAYRHELIYSSVIAALFYVFLQVVYGLWQPLAQIVLQGVHGLLALVSIDTTLVSPNILLTDKFGITIAESCSGIESIALFSGLYIIVGLLDRDRLNVWRYTWVFPIALTLLFALNIVRVFALIAAGYYINAELAFSLFHTYAGLIFFVLYSAVFWAIAYRYIVKRHENLASN